MVDDTAGNGRLALVTGATGYIGSQVIEKLVREGWAVRALSRSRAKAATSAWHRYVTGAPAQAGQVEIFEGDADNAEDLGRALTGVDTAWYLLHSMGSGPDFREQEQQMAHTFAAAAHEQEVSRIIYLGGLHPDDQELSEHLASRREVGQVLLGSGVPTAALQAGVVLGGGSKSFTMLRHLAERLPGAFGPSWINNQITPISIRDAVHYLVAAAELPSDVNRAFDIGGPDTLAYGEMMSRYAQAVGLPPRLVFTLPVVTPNLAAQWMSLVTPVPAKVAGPLISSVLADTVVKERDLEQLVGRPEGGNQGFEKAIRDATTDLTTRRSRHTLLKTGAAVAVTATVGTALTDPENSWYRKLDKPAWQPPKLDFPLAWTVLYLDIAVVSALVIADAEEKKRGSSAPDWVVLGTNLVLNAGWCGLFFRARRPWVAAAGAAALAVSSADLTRRAWKSSPQRGVLLSPYAAWTGFATVLSTSIAWRNRS